MKHFVVTVGCEYGSGGIEIGKMIAKSLGVEYYPTHPTPPPLAPTAPAPDPVKKADQGETVKYEFDTSFGPRYANLTNRVIYKQFEVINKFAENSSCVIIGRCSNYILKDREDCLNLFIYAPTEKRIQYVMEKKGLKHDEAAELVKYNDGMLSSRYNYMTGGDMRDCSMRDMMIDSSVLGLEKTAKYILQMIDLRFED